MRRQRPFIGAALIALLSGCGGLHCPILKIGSVAAVAVEKVTQRVQAGAGHRFRHLSFSTDGRALVTVRDNRRHKGFFDFSGSAISEVAVLEIQSGKSILAQTVEGGTAAIAIGGEALAIQTGVDMVGVYSLANGKLAQSFKAPEPIWQINFSPGGRVIGVATRSSIILYDVATGALLRTIALAKPILSFDFSPRGDTIAAVLQERETTWERPALRLFAAVLTLGAVSNAGGPELEYTGNVHLFHASTGEETALLDVERWAYSATWGSSGVLLVDEPDTVRVFDGETRRGILKFPKAHADRSQVSGNGNTVTVRDRAYAVKPAQCLAEFAEGYVVTSYALSYDGTQLAILTLHDLVEIRNLRTGDVSGPPIKVDGNNCLLAFSPDGSTLAIGCDDGFRRLLTP